MKKLLFILPLVLIVGCSKPVEDSTLIKKNGLMYLLDSDTPYTGEVYFNYDTGEKEYQGTYENGLLIEYSYINKDGTVKEPINVETTLVERDGIYYTKDTNKPYSGSVFSLFSDGKKREEGTYKNGQEDGKWTKWYENGKKFSEIIFKDGKQDGKWVEWYENGQKEEEGTYKDGKQDGLWTYYRKDGSNEKEGYFENGLKTHKWWYWDENGKYYHIIKIRLELDIIPLLGELASKRDAQLDGVLNNVVGEKMLNLNFNFFTVFEKEFSIQDIKLSRYYHLYGASADEIITALKIEVDNANNRILEILQNRLDQFGVAEPTIKNQGRRFIIVELPVVQAVQDAKRTRFLLQSTGLLEFFLVKDVNTTNEILVKIDQALKGNETIADVIESASVEEVEETKESNDQTVSISELFGETEELGASSDSEVVDEDMFAERSFSSMLRNLGQEIGIPEKNVYAVKKILERPEVQEKLAAVGGTFLFSHKAEVYFDEKIYSLYLLEDKAELTGEVVEEAKANLGPRGSTSVGQPIVNLTMNSDGARKWSIVTGSNVGRRVAIVLDKIVRMVPNIREKISNGRTLIEGIANINEAKDIAIVLNAGALPMSVKIIDERILKKYVE
jgi:protein-export membrane protein SecD|tara:strand:+ start:170 stop:2017 length:1848 start_codon:yes stop_codon:yes gene_type:complete